MKDPDYTAEDSVNIQVCPVPLRIVLVDLFEIITEGDYADETVKVLQECAKDRVLNAIVNKRVNFRQGTDLIREIEREW